MTRDVFLCDGIRSAFGRYGGVLAGVRADDLAGLTLSALMARHPDLDWGATDDVILGCANQAGEDNRNVARMALLLAGLPESVPGVTVNRLCASGLDALAMGARSIACGEAELIIAGGVESMSRAPFVVPKATQPFSRDLSLQDTTMGWRFVNPEMQRRFGVESMPETAENVAAAFGISRADQDAFALRSQQRAAAAQANGEWEAEIAPLELRSRAGTSVVDRDEHPRATTMEALARLPTPFRTAGTVTAGNASGINDGSAVLLLASEGAIRRHRLTRRARIIGSAVAGVAPRLMGIGPVPATRKLLERLKLGLQDMDVIELNEAFAAQALAVLRELGVADDAAHVNPNGGAIALGHPLGASGARLALTAMRQLERVGGRYGLCTMCIGVGQGIALILERSDGSS